MAKIGIVTSAVDHSRLQLALALRSQQHEVFFITEKSSKIDEEAESSAEDSNLSSSFESRRYFQKWSISEASYFFFKGLSNWPDILYFTFGESENEKAHRAHVTLAHLTKTLPGRVVATSYFGKLKRRGLNSALIRASDVFTAATREDLMMAKRKGLLSIFGESEVLPPIYPYIPTSEVENTISSELEKLCREISPYVFFPSHLTEPLKKGLQNTSHILIHGRRPQARLFSFKNKRAVFLKPEFVFYTGFAEPMGSQKQILENHLHLKTAIRQARWVVTAFQDLPLSSLQRIHQIATKYHIPILASPEQTELVPGLCIHQRNGWIVRNPDELEKWLLQLDREPAPNDSLDSENLGIDDLLLQNPKFEMGNWNFGDASLNELNRLFTKARSKKLLPSRGREWGKSSYHHK